MRKLELEVDTVYHISAFFPNHGEYSRWSDHPPPPLVPVLFEPAVSATPVCLSSARVLLVSCVLCVSVCVPVLCVCFLFLR